MSKQKETGSRGVPDGVSNRSAQSSSCQVPQELPSPAQLIALQVPDSVVSTTASDTVHGRQGFPLSITSAP